MHSPPGSALNLKREYFSSESFLFFSESTGNSTPYIIRILTEKGPVAETCVTITFLPTVHGSSPEIGPNIV